MLQSDRPNINEDLIGPEMFIRLIFIFFVVGAQKGLAIPEAVRYGQFSCVSCHVSPGGGGTLTNYGRMFSGEKLSTWSIEGEENLFYSLILPRETILAGGDARWVYESRDNGETKFRKFWRMQTDLELVLHVGDLWVQGVMGTKPAGPLDNPKDHSRLIHRAYSVRYDLFDEHVLLRAGLFAPRFGLMIADHTAFNRIAMGFDPDDEQTQVEISYQDDDFEVMAASLIQNSAYDRAQKSKTGFNLGLAKKLGNRQRLGVGVLSAKRSQSTSASSLTGFGISAVATVTNQLFALLEMDRIANRTEGEGMTLRSEAFATFLTLNYEVFRGFSPFLRHEYWDRNLGTRGLEMTRYGGGVNCYPRPHFQTELRSLVTKQKSNNNATSETEAILHYYF